MKPSQNNLSVILTYAVPTAAALLGLLWLLRRRRGEDDDDDTSAADVGKRTQKETLGIVTAPSTLPREHRMGDEALDRKKNAVSGVSFGDFSAQKPPQKQVRQGGGIMKTRPSDGKPLGAGDMITGSVQVSTSNAVVGFSTQHSIDRNDQSAAAAHSSKVSSVLSSILPASIAGSEKDPVQVLVSRNEDRLKQDDASIVQAKLSTSTLQSLPPNSSTAPSSDSSQASLQTVSSPSTQESLFAKEIVQDVLAQAARVHSQSVASAQVSSGSCVTDSTSSVTSILKQSARLENSERLSGTSLEPDGGASESSTMNSNSNSNNSGISTQVSDSQSRIDISRAGIQLQSNAPEEKATQNLLAQRLMNQKGNASSKDSDINSSKIVVDNSESRISQLERQIVAAEFVPKTSATLKEVQTRDRNSEERASKTNQSLNSAAEKGAPSNQDRRKGSEKGVSCEDVKQSPNSKDARSNQGSLSKDKSSSSSPSSVKSAPLSAGAKTSPHQQSAKAATEKSEKQSSSQSKLSGQQTTKSTSSPSNSYSNKRRTRSGSSTGDVASEGSPEGHNSESQASPAVTQNGRLPDSGSPVCDSNSEASNDSGRGGSVGDTLIPLSGTEVVRYEFNFPSDLCGRLIGRGGKNIQQIKEQSGANVTLSSNPFTPEFQVCSVQGMQPEVDRALMLIRKKFPQAQYPHLDMASLTPIPSPAPVVLPEIMQMNLPEGVSVEIVVSAIVNAGHIFVQQPAHPTFPSLERLNHFMNACYSDQNAPLLPRPVEGGIICAAESEGQWYRAQLVQVYPAEDECDIKFVDYGGYTRVPVNTLKQIRSDFMTLPFQAVECYLANITPLQEEEYFSDRASEVLAELTSGKMLQGQVIARGEDSVCYVHLYQVSGHSVLMINRELVNREVARWIEIL
ncbi:A-kinase anchor protein 1, mitochondrial-like [Littorina saxatilis]|uniref:Tudor domain-containing protein n=1 Tax=Littorina saxatilis TaxID=31220 RepID=A0AAN9AIT6_9CAEN